MLIFYLVTLLNSLICSSRFFCRFFGIFCIAPITSAANKNNFLLLCLSFHFLLSYCQLGLSLLNNSGKSRHPWLIPSLAGKVFSLLSLILILATGFLLIFLINLRRLTSILTFLRVFIMNGCCILSSVFSVSIDMIVWFFFFSLLIWWITLIDFQKLSKLCIPGGNPIYMGGIFEFFYILLNSFCWGLLEIFVSTFMRDITSEVFVLFFFFFFWYCISLSLVSG